MPPASSWDVLREVMDDGLRSINQRLERYGPLEPHRFSLKEVNPRLAKLAERGRQPRMQFRVEVICVNDEGTEQRHGVMEMERRELAMETLGLSLAEGKAILRGVQDFVASQQTSEDLQCRRSCPNCGQRYHSKEAGTSSQLASKLPGRSSSGSSESSIWSRKRRVRKLPTSGSWGDATDRRWGALFTREDAVEAAWAWWSTQSLRGTTRFAPTGAEVGGRKRLTRLSLRSLVGTTPYPRRDFRSDVPVLGRRHLSNGLDRSRPAC